MEKNMFFVIPEMPSKTFDMVLNKIFIWTQALNLHIMLRHPVGVRKAPIISNIACQVDFSFLLPFRLLLPLPPLDELVKA